MSLASEEAETLREIARRRKWLGGERSCTLKFRDVALESRFSMYCARRMAVEGYLGVFLAMLVHAIIGICDIVLTATIAPDAVLLTSLLCGGYAVPLAGQLLATR